MNEQFDEKLYDLLCKQAVYGLTEEETRQLAEAATNASVDENLQSFELAVAALSLADLNVDEPLPTHLESKILVNAEKHFASLRSSEAIHESIHDMETREIKWVEPKPARSLFDWIGWAVAAAACVALAANIYLTRSPSTQIVEVTTPTPVQGEKLSPAQQRERLLASTQDIARADLTNPDKNSPNNVAGDVVWSDSKQAGYVRVTGLPVNDPSKETYQLWIVDESQDPKTPIDGGTFDIAADGEVVIPIDARLKAKNPKAFAITVEKPGGVVVSKQKVVALAPVKPKEA